MQKISAEILLQWGWLVSTWPCWSIEEVVIHVVAKELDLVHVHLTALKPRLYTFESMLQT
jgi:hypothetical protein